MSTYDLDEMVKRWGQDKLTMEQAIGQILQHLQGIIERLGKVERLVEEQRVIETAVTPPQPKRRGERKRNEHTGS